MELRISSERDNLFFNRKEVDFVLSFPGEKTPNRESVRAIIASHYNHKKELVIIDYLKQETGKPEAKGYAKLYKTEGELRSHERDYILIRHGFIKKEKK